MQIVHPKKLTQSEFISQTRSVAPAIDKFNTWLNSCPEAIVPKDKARLDHFVKNYSKPNFPHSMTRFIHLEVAEEKAKSGLKFFAATDGEGFVQVEPGSNDCFAYTAGTAPLYAWEYQTKTIWIVKPPRNRSGVVINVKDFKPTPKVTEEGFGDETSLKIDLFREYKDVKTLNAFYVPHSEARANGLLTYEYRRINLGDMKVNNIDAVGELLKDGNYVIEEFNENKCIVGTFLVSMDESKTLYSYLDGCIYICQTKKFSELNNPEFEKVLNFIDRQYCQEKSEFALEASADDLMEYLDVSHLVFDGETGEKVSLYNRIPRMVMFYAFSGGVSCIMYNNLDTETVSVIKEMIELDAWDKLNKPAFEKPVSTRKLVYYEHAGKIQMDRSMKIRC